MNDKDDFVAKTVQFIETQVCPLTDQNKCQAVVKDYSFHKNEIRLVDDVFEVLIKCDEEVCTNNMDDLKSKIITYLDQNKV